MMGHDLSADLLGQPPLGAKSEMKTAIKGSDANEKGDKTQRKFIRIALCQVSLSSTILSFPFLANVHFS